MGREGLPPQKQIPTSSPIQIPYAEKHREAEGLREQFARRCVCNVAILKPHSVSRLTGSEW